MRFRDRREAATLLAERLAAYRCLNPLVLGVPRGAVPMARIIADALDGDLDVVLVRKLRAPNQPELALGAIDERGTVVRGRYFGLASDDYLREEIRLQQGILRSRRQLYTQARPPVDPAGRIGNRHFTHRFFRGLSRFLARHLAMQTQCFGDLFADGINRIERCHRILEDHGDIVAAHLAHFGV